MGHHIEYQWTCLALGPDGTARDKEASGAATADARYVIAIEGGPSNCYSHGSQGSRRVRHWGIGMIGTSRQILRQATRFASDCEGGMLKPGGRDCRPEAYIGRIRRLLERPEDTSWSMGHVVLHAKLPVDHPLTQVALGPGFGRENFREWGQDYVRLAPAGRDLWAEYLTLIDPYLDDFSLPPWSTGAVYGLPSS